MALHLTGISTFITGAGSGIGKATALKFASEGAKVFLVGRTESKLVDVQTEINTKYPHVEVAYAAADVSDKKAMDDAMKIAVEKFGGLTVIVANAGLSTPLAADFEEWETCITTNLTSVMYLSKIALPHLEASVKTIGHASFIVISSVCSYMKIGFLAPYCASKHGVSGFTLSLFEAVKDKGIKVTSINPGVVDTPMAQSSGYPYPKKASIPPESIAHTIHFAATFPDFGCPSEITVAAQYSQ